MGTDNTIFWIQLITAIISFTIIILGGILCLLLYKNKKAKLESEEEKSDSSAENKKPEGKSQGKISIKKFMEFDDIVDNMIVRKNRQQYVMVVKCKGIDYDLLSEVLLSKKNVILQGAPGVGKTFMARRLAYSIMGMKDKSRAAVAASAKDGAGANEAAASSSGEQGGLF